MAANRSGVAREAAITSPSLVSAVDLLTTRVPTSLTVVLGARRPIW